MSSYKQLSNQGTLLLSSALELARALTNGGPSASRAISTGQSRRRCRRRSLLPEGKAGAGGAGAGAAKAGGAVGSQSFPARGRSFSIHAS